MFLENLAQIWRKQREKRLKNAENFPLNNKDNRLKFSKLSFVAPLVGLEPTTP